MIFETIYQSAQQGELILIDGGYCRWHLRKDGHITIYEIISISPGAGTKMLEQLKQKKAKSIFARCPVDLSANYWYAKKGFELEGTEETSSGREIYLWRLSLS